MNPNNESREAPSDSTYAVTINVYPSKIVSRRRVWKQHSSTEQKEIILFEVSQALHRIGKSSVDFSYVFEKTKDGNEHLHGVIRCTHSQIIDFQDTIHQALGLPSVLPSRVCFIELTKVSAIFWQNYMNKDQCKSKPIDFIPDKSMFYP